MSINMNGQSIIQLTTSQSNQLTHVANVNYVNIQTENKGSNALQGYPEAITNLQTEVSSVEMQIAKLVKLDGSSNLSGDVTCSSISGLVTSQDTQLTDIANVNYVKTSMDHVIVNPVNDNIIAISAANTKITILTTELELEKLVKLDGSSLLSGDVICPSISELPTPTSTQLTNISDVNYVIQSMNTINNNSKNTPYISYSEGTMDQKVFPGQYCSFDTTKLSSKSSNIDEYISVTSESIQFYKPGTYYIYAYLGNVTATTALFKQCLFLTYSYNSTQNRLAGFYYFSPAVILGYPLASSFVIQKKNIIGGSEAVSLQLPVTGGTSSDYMQVSKMQWFIIKLTPMYS